MTRKSRPASYGSGPQTQGYEGGITILKDHVATVRPEFLAARTYRRTSYLPGEIGRLDWWRLPGRVPVGREVTRRAFALVLTLPPSAAHVAFFTHTCYHCAEPACVEACPVGASTKSKTNGVVLVDRDTCLGKDNCDLCLQACVYKAPQFGAEPNAKMQKCNLCPDRLEEGKQPICVAGCPMRALDAGPIEELIARYADAREAEGFIYSHELNPSIVFKPKVK